jgi:hypothetical protein
MDTLSKTADVAARNNIERQLLEQLGHNQAELRRIGQMLELLNGPLATLCDKAAAFADQLDDLPNIIGQAIAANPSFAQALYQIGTLKEQLQIFQADVGQLAEHHQQAAAIFVRIQRVAEYFDELWQAGIKPKEFAQMLHKRTQVVTSIQQGRTTGVDSLLEDMRRCTPQAASIPLLQAAVAVREYNYSAAQQALATLVRLIPADSELLELSRQIATLATQTTTPAAHPARELLKLMAAHHSPASSAAGTPERHSLSENVIRAWKEAGAAFGWTGRDPNGNWKTMESTPVGLSEPLPTFRFRFDSDDSLKKLRRLPIPNAPFALDLSFTQVTDLQPLAQLTQLKSLDLSETKVDELQVRQLQQKLPNCLILLW